MDTELLVEEWIEDGQKLVDLLAESKVEILGACWFRDAERGRWWLYIATKLVDEEGSASVYRIVLGLLAAIPGDRISSSDVKVIGEHHPVAEIIERYLARIEDGAARSNHPVRINPWSEDEVYVYPTRPIVEWPRLQFTVTYARQGAEDRWEASTELGELYRDIDFEGVASYSSNAPGASALGTPDLLTVSGLFRINPRFAVDPAGAGAQQIRLWKYQARAFADPIFRSVHRGGSIADEVDG